MKMILAFLKELLPNLIAEVFSIQSIKKMMKKEVGDKAVDKATSVAESKVGGILNLSDEKSFLALLAKVLAKESNADEIVKNVSSFMKRKLDHSQRRRFRVAFGDLANKEDEEGDKKINLGVEFLVEFWKFSDERKLDVCKASGLLDSDIDLALVRAKKVKRLAEKAIAKNIDEIELGSKRLRRKIRGDRPYRGFWNELLRR